jgi:hypothetical protein
MTNSSKYSRVVRYLCEALFSWNLALIAKLRADRIPFFLLDFGQFEVQFWINRHLHLHPHSDIGGDSAFLIYALIWALFIFLVLRLFSGTRITSGFLRWAAGVFSLLALPVSWLYQGTAPTVPDPPHVLLVLELLLATGSAILFLLSRRPFPMWSMIVILVPHFVLWGWLFLGGPYFWLAPFETIVPLAGFFSSLAWGLYVSHESADRTATDGTAFEAG